MRTHPFARQFFVAVLTVSLSIAAASVTRAADENGKPIPGIGPTGAPVELAGTFKFTEGPATDKDGVVYFTDVPADKVFKVDPGNKTSLFRSDTNHANGQMFNCRRRDRLLPAQRRRRLVPHDKDRARVGRRVRRQAAQRPERSR